MERWRSSSTYGPSSGKATSGANSGASEQSTSSSTRWPPARVVCCSRNRIRCGTLVKSKGSHGARTGIGADLGSQAQRNATARLMGTAPAFPCQLDAESGAAVICSGIVVRPSMPVHGERHSTRFQGRGSCLLQLLDNLGATQRVPVLSYRTYYPGKDRTAVACSGRVNCRQAEVLIASGKRSS